MHSGHLKYISHISLYSHTHFLRVPLRQSIQSFLDMLELVNQSSVFQLIEVEFYNKPDIDVKAK